MVFIRILLQPCTEFTKKSFWFRQRGPRISEEYCVQLYLYFIIQSAVKFSKNRKYCLCRLFCERKWCRSLKHCYSTAILLSIVKYNEYNVIKKRENMLWKIKCPFENVGAKKQRKSIRINNRSKVVCDDVNNFGSSVADKSMDEHRQTEKQQITIDFLWYCNVMPRHVICLKINFHTNTWFFTLHMQGTNSLS